MDFAYWWSCINQGLRLMFAQHVCTLATGSIVQHCTVHHNQPQQYLENITDIDVLEWVKVWHLSQNVILWCDRKQWLWEGSCSVGWWWPGWVSALPLLALHWWFQDTALHRIVMHCTVLILHFTLLVLHYITLSSGPHYTALHCTDTVLSNPHCVSPVTCHLSFVTDVCHTTHITVHSINTQYTSLLASTLSCLTLPCLVTLHCAIQVLYCTALLASTLHYFTTLQQYNTVYSLYSVQSVLLSSLHCPTLHSTARSFEWYEPIFNRWTYEHMKQPRLHRVC